ncbi:nucleoside hydrolase [Diplocloster hominis]|uniref:nucleoside hydrolase n=1 Tax=Diplocloster hominis TaxID=3079010 RepID=UPI0031BA7226
MAKKQIIIDTDIGDDVDDAFAIALALVSPEIELMGITTVFKNTYARAELALAVLEHYGRTDIPVYAGCGRPLKNQADTAEMPAQHRMIPVKKRDIQPGDAAEYIISQVRNYPELTVVGIGPLTNLAHAFLKAPEVMKRSRLVLMGGTYNRMYPEWNILCDPEAAKIVLESGADVIIAGLDVTTKLKLGREELAQIHGCSSDREVFLADLMNIWYERSGAVVLHDPLVVLYMIQPDLLRLAPSNVCVELNGEATRGLTYRVNDWWGNFESGPVKVAIDADADAAVSMFMKRVFTA